MGGGSDGQARRLQLRDGDDPAQCGAARVPDPLHDRRGGRDPRAAGAPRPADGGPGGEGRRTPGGPGRDRPPRHRVPRHRVRGLVLQRRAHLGGARRGARRARERGSRALRRVRPPGAAVRVGPGDVHGRAHPPGDPRAGGLRRVPHLGHRGARVGDRDPLRPSRDHRGGPLPVAGDPPVDRDPPLVLRAGRGPRRPTARLGLRPRVPRAHHRRRAPRRRLRRRGRLRDRERRDRGGGPGDHRRRPRSSGLSRSSRRPSGRW